jgi:phosphoribosylamine---glycine ligase
MKPALLFYGEFRLNILIVGGGGREHAFAWRLARSSEKHNLFASPGNPGIASLGQCLPAPPGVSGYIDMAEKLAIDLTIVGPEAPLVAGIVDRFRARGLRILGPTEAAARLEGSKIFAKQFLERTGIPTAQAVQVQSVEEGLAALPRFSLPVVVKADGLAAGKGVTVAQTRAEAREAVERLGPRLLIEEFLEGEEVSFIGLSTGETLVPLPPTQDHKRAFDGDLGPNTGGMGAYLDSRILTSAQSGEIMDRIMLPVIRQMAKEGTPFTGFLYAGLMMTAEGPKVLEFNVRMGDPEAQVILYSFEGNLPAFLQGEKAPALDPQPSACVVLAAAGYPEQPHTGDAIRGIDEAETTGATVFQAGTQMADNQLVTSGGRVLGVTAGGKTLAEAIDGAYAAARRIHFEGMHFRTDIGRKGLRRW